MKVSGKRVLVWAVIGAAAIAGAVVASPAYYGWSFRNRLASLPERARAILAIVPSESPPVRPQGPGVSWKGILIPAPAGDSARLEGDGSSVTCFAAGIRVAFTPAPADLPVLLLREELQAIGSDPSRAPGDALSALRRIGGASPESFRFHIRRAILEEQAAELLAKLRLIPIERPTRMGWSEDPPGLWVASDAAVWAVRLLSDEALILSAEIEDATAGGDLGLWIAAFGCRWTP